MEYVNKIIPIVKDLSEASSTASKIANQFWIGLIIISVFVLFPTYNNNGEVIAPFGVGVFNPEQYTYWGGIALFSLIMVFCSAYLHSIRVQLLSYKKLDSLRKDDKDISYYENRELLDSLRLPNLSRVAPIAQIIRGKYQFYDKKSECPTWLLCISGSYYLLLKIFSWGVYFGVPIISYIIACSRTLSLPDYSNKSGFFLHLWSPVIFFAYAFITLIVLFQTIYIEIKNSLKAFSNIRNK